MNTNINIRQLTDDDARALERLVALDSGQAPAAPLLGAEVEGRLLAAVSIASGASVADPFSRTSELRDLLELRALQLRGRERPSRRRRRGTRRSRASASAPAPAGQLLGLHPRAS
ncbi:MAG: hypothetical protein ACR2G3_02185 [Solirubrobacterales bacterium]